MSRVLVVDDERHISEGVRFNLQADGHEVIVAETGERALALLLAADATFDVVVLDVMLPGKNGFEVASELRAAGQYIPILMLTAHGRPEDVLRGFESGADDYLPKPFELGILLARVGGLLRRRRWNERDAPVVAEAPNDTYAFAGRTLDFTAMEIRARGKTHRLTQMESELLRYLVSHAGQVVSRRTLLEEVWGLHESTDTRAIDNFVVRLRRYLEDRPGSPQFLRTVRGIGYKFQPDAARPT